MIGKRYHQNTLLFPVAMILFTVSVMLEKSVWAFEINGLSAILKMLRYAAYFIALIKIISDKIYKKKEFMILIPIMAVVVASMVGSTNRTMFLYMFFFVAAIGVSSETLIKCTSVIQAFFLFIIVGCAVLGLVPDYIWGAGGRVRHFLGFTWTTTGPIVFFYLLLQYILLKKGRLRFREYAVFMLIDLYFYKMTDSRMTFALSVLCITFFLLYPYFFAEGAFVEKLKYIFIAAPFVLAIISIWAAVCYDASNSVWRAVNSFLSSRLKLGQKGMHEFGITLFGQPIKWEGYNLQVLLNGQNAEYNYVDNSYLQVLYEYGLLFLLIVLLAFAALMYMSIMEKKYYLSWILLFVLIFGLTEPRLVNLSYNPFVLLCATEWGSHTIVCRNAGENE